ncbi:MULTISPECIES: hypothetical protein [Haloferax]|uniref:Uncharacterized protein n=1 Tax=Haloferax massiliensis TaxID=1476858 RepID=A0A0D6JLH4_9EURY|nr:MULTISPECIES: hypothetical protein [Haloferax]CQR48762.1 hypothetical protein BN996_00210 [Haloferax massiliensis]
MSFNDNLSIRMTEVALSVATLLVVVVLLAIPPVQLSSIAAGSPAGIAIALGIWAVPTLLGAVALYHVYAGPRRLASYLTGGLSVLTLGIVVLNVSAVLTTDGAFTYGGSGAFAGPIIALFIASLLGFVVLVDTGVTAIRSPTQ